MSKSPTPAVEVTEPLFGWQPISNHSGYEAVAVCRAAEPQRAAIRAFRGIDGEWRALLPDGSSERLRFTPTHFQPDLDLPEVAAEEGMGEQDQALSGRECPLCRRESCGWNGIPADCDLWGKGAPIRKLAQSPVSEGAEDVVERAARAALLGVEFARTDVVKPVNGRAPYSYVQFHGQRVEFHDGEFDTAFERDAGSAKAASYATKINDALFDLAKSAALIALRSPGPRELREALIAAYIQGATDVHEHWAAGNAEREPDFAEAASDYAASIAATPAPVVEGEGMVMVSKCPFCLGLSRYSGNPKDVFCAEHFAQFERTTDA